jgi:hypothetical protein
MINFTLRPFFLKVFSVGLIHCVVSYVKPGLDMDTVQFLSEIELRSPNAQQISLLNERSQIKKS